MPVCRTATSLALTAIGPFAWIAALRAQGDVDVPAIERAFDDLADPARARAAAGVLERGGPEVAVRLAAKVVVPQRYVEPRPLVLGALYVLGRMGETARPALAAIASAAVDRDTGIADQALWALAEVGQHEAAERRERLAAALPEERFAARVAQQRLRLGAAAAPAELRVAVCAAEPERVIAACMQGLGRGIDPDDVDHLRLDLRRQLALALQPLAEPWDDRPLRAAAAPLAAALVSPQLRGNATDGDDAELQLLIGRGLLRHYDRALRRRALPMIQGLGAAGLLERAELLPLLVDGDAELRQLAAWTFQGLGRAGLVALPLLRRLQDRDGDVGVRLACGSVADDLLRACGDDGSALLAAVDARLRGAVTTPLAMPTEAPAIGLLVDLLCGAEWVEAEITARLLPVPQPGSHLPPPLCAAGLRLCINVDARLRVVAAGWLARGADGAALPDLEQTIDRMAAMTGIVDPEVVEMLAWVRAGGTASPTALLAAMAHQNPRVAVRAAVEWIERGLAAGAGDLDFLHRTAAAVAPPVDELGALVLGVDLEAEVRAAAVLVLHAANARDVDPAPLRLLAPAGSERARWIAEALQAGRVRELARLLETRVTERLAVPDGVAPR